MANKIIYATTPSEVTRIIQLVTDMYINEMVNIDRGLLLEKTTDGVKDWAKQEWKEHRTMVFDSQGEGSWSPNRGMYAEWKREKFPDSKILELTGNLKNAYTGDWIVDNDGMKVNVKCSVPDYAKYHQEGIPPPNWRNVLPFLKRQFHYLTYDLIVSAGNRIGKKVLKEVMAKIRQKLEAMG
ncbi:MAG: hypothetical protein GYA14_14050 [Ignavibacteria bacterium]|nr:hypothetical protein [Ignavibacteria bacterium]